MAGFEFGGLKGLPQEYFSSLCFRSDGSDLFHLGVLHALGVPAPSAHPPATPLTVSLGELAEHAGITEAVLRCFTAASRIGDAQQQLAFVAGVSMAFGAPPRVYVPTPMEPGVPTDDADTDAEAEELHYGGTIEGKKHYWRQGKNQSVTWLYTGAEAAAIGVSGTQTDCFYISNHTQILDPQPTDTKLTDVRPSGFINVETSTLLMFPSVDDTEARWAARVDGVIDELLSRGGRLNRSLKRGLKGLAVRRSVRTHKRGKCDLCGLQRTLSHIAYSNLVPRIHMGSTCASQLSFCIRLARIPVGQDPSAVLADLAGCL